MSKKPLSVREMNFEKKILLIGLEVDNQKRKL